MDFPQDKGLICMSKELSSVVSLTMTLCYILKKQFFSSSLSCSMESLGGEILGYLGSAMLIYRRNHKKPSM